MKPLIRLIPLLFIAVALLVACGGSDNTLVGDSGDSGDGSSPSGQTVDSIVLRTSTTQIPSDGSRTATLSAVVKDAGNRVLTDVPVDFSASSGFLIPTQPQTDTTGTARAEISAGANAENRAITVTAHAGNASADISVTVSGTSISISGPDNIAPGSGTNNTYTVKLLDNSGNGIGGQLVTVTSAQNATITPTSGTMETNLQGELQFKYKSVSSENDTLTVSALGITRSKEITVTDQLITLTADSGCAKEPADGGPPRIEIGLDCTIIATRTGSGKAVQGQQIAFSIGRGTINPIAPVTDVDGHATARASSDSAGSATITATDGTVSSTLQVEFIATKPATVSIKALSAQVRPGGATSLTATVLDDHNNLVTGAEVKFRISEDPTSGTLSVTTSETDLNGTAQSVFTAGNRSSGTDGVLIVADVLENGIVTATDSVKLTVNSEALTITLGTGNEISELETTRYSLPYVVQVADSTGNPVPGAQVDLSVISRNYYIGCFTQTGKASSCGGSLTGTVGDWDHYIVNGCKSEDRVLGDEHDLNGKLDDGEDKNGNKKLDVGYIAVVSSSGQVTTDELGSASFTVVYPQNYAFWLQVRLRAHAKVAGSEGTNDAIFLLPALADDYNGENNPPALISPFDNGNGTCAVPD